MFKIGLIVNPIAGMGGKVGLKGTDGKVVLTKALEMGAKKESPRKTVKALKCLAGIGSNLSIVTYSGDMGESECLKAGLSPVVIGESGKTTTPEDTERAAEKMMDQGVDLILFSGGDGTARNIYNIVKDNIPVIGIPCGVKIHSAVFAKNSVDAGMLVMNIYNNTAVNCVEREVMDIDEESLRNDKVKARLYGYMKVPYNKKYIQNLKSGGMVNDDHNLSCIANYVIENMEEDSYYIIGAGTTTRRITTEMNVDYTLLGVDVVYKGELILKDACESDLLVISKNRKCKIIVSPIGGQGFLFGRGNQQISSDVIMNVGKENISIISTPEKMIALLGSPLLVDTGDSQMDDYLKGIYKVVVGYDNFYVWKCE